MHEKSLKTAMEWLSSPYDKITQEKVINSEPSDLKKTNSKTGICGIALTHKCIKEKAKEEIIIY